MSRLPDERRVRREGRTALLGQPVFPAAQKDGGQLVSWFKRLEHEIKQQHLGPEIHWVRLYYGQARGRTLACEVLLDNDPWEESLAALATFDWPPAQDFYSVRMFLVVGAGAGTQMTPENAVARLAEIVASDTSLNEDEVCQALANSGVPSDLAFRAYSFTQIAWGRAFLGGMGITFSTDYLCFNGKGKVVESARLADEPCFVAATQLVKKHAGTPAFERMAATSSEVDAINKAVDGGSKPEDLIMGPACLFLEPMTAQGLADAEQAISQQVAAIGGQAGGKPRKPWWRFLG